MLEVDDQVWARIFAVCGGNAARLALVAETVETPEDLSQVTFRSRSSLVSLSVPYPLPVP